MYIAYPRIARTFALTKKEKMEKRIKTVWILTIITAILIIGGQGYWLHHEGGNLAASKIRNLECPSYEICLIDYGCGKFNRKIHIMEQYP